MPRIMAMHDSMMAHCQPFTLWVLALTGPGADLLSKLALSCVDVILMEDIVNKTLADTRQGRSWFEWVWTLKPHLIWNVLGKVEAVTYVDGDGYFFSSPEPLYREIGNAPLAITPHRFPPRLQSYAVNGKCNGGFVYATKKGRPRIAEWAAQCRQWCYLKYDTGNRFVDQKYLDGWSEAHHIAHVGVNCAPWNQEQYTWARSGRNVTLNDVPLIWYHFHQCLEPAYPVGKFVQDNVYGAYAAALDAARERIARCG